MTPDEQAMLAELLAPRPQYDLGGLQGIPNDLSMNMPSAPSLSPLAADRILPEHGYQSIIDPMYLSEADDTTPASLPSLGLDQPSNDQPPAWVNVLKGIGTALEAGSAGFFGRTPLYMQQQALDQQGQALNQQNALRRMTLAQQLQQQEETKRQHKQKMFIDIMTKPGLSDSQRQGLLQPFADEDEQFRTAIDGIGKKRFGKLNSYAKLYPDEMNQMLQDWQSGSLTSDDIDQRFSVLEDRTKRRAAAKAEATEYKRLSAVAEQSMRDGTPMDPADQAEFVRMQTEMAKRQEELQAIRLKNELSQKKIDDPGSEKPDRTEINRVSLAETGKPFDELPPGGPEQKRVIQAHAERYALGRTNVMMGTPIPVEKRSNLIDRNEFLKHDKLVNPPQGATEGATRSGAFVEMTDKQREDWGNLVNSGATLQTLFDEIEPLITAESPAKAAKQFARLHLEAATKKNPKAATYLADSEAFSSRMARVFGSEVGVLTNPDVERWRRALPTFGDTKQVVAEKKKLFMSIYKQTKDMYKKKIAGEDYSEDLVALRRGPLAAVDKIAPPSVDEDFSSFFGGK